MGIDDHFLTLGGDSILSILLVSRARRRGLELTLRDVFKHPTVETLAAMAQLSQDVVPFTGDAAAAIGEVTTTPIMRWFLERCGPIARFYQSILLRVPSDLAQPAATAASRQWSTPMTA